MVIYISLKPASMIKYLWLLVSVVLLGACQQPGKKPAAQKDSTATVTATNFYKQFKGSLADQPVTMHLIRTGEFAYQGWYVYDKIGDPIQLLNEPDSAGKITLLEYSSQDEANTFYGQLSPDGHFTGTWKSAKGEYNFALKEDYTQAVQFNIFTFSDTVTLFYNNPKSPMGIASASIVWPVAGADEAALNIIKQVIADSSNNVNNPEMLVKAPVDTFLQFYKSSRDDADTTALGASWDWSTQTDTRVVWNQYPLLVLENAEYAYTGGAHGNWGSGFHVIDLSKKKELKVTDVFKPGYKTQLSTALAKAFRKKYNLPAGEPLDKRFLFSKTINPNDNFFLTNKGVVFNYTPYEIAAYAVGQITLFIPFEDVKTIVNEAYLP
jgi:hypothetical protein